MTCTNVICGNHMSSGILRDWKETKKQLRDPEPCNGGKTWLRHSITSFSREEHLHERSYLHYR
jgi:hypothetical protein